ncbi:hypothetical protein [Micromonospora aurantiaca]|uniref:hypothetical protein n=2 Tax=Micromonospora TaxID=1873 RepID=UPI0011CD3F53|nr:hypothetical protein [Micromonospora aurantiaca]
MSSQATEAADLERGLMKRSRLLVMVGLSVVLIACCGTFGRTLWPPVSHGALCGKFVSSQGGEIQIQSTGAFEVTDAIFGWNSDGSMEKVSGSGNLRLERSLTANAEVAMPMKDAKATLELKTQRNWRGDISLWHYVDDPDSGERETFRRESEC